MKKISLETIGNFAEKACEIISYGVFMAASYKLVEYAVTEHDNAIVSYDDAIEAIMKSNMYAHDKSNAVSALKRYEGSSFYKAIIHIAKDSDMYSHNKVDMIKKLCEK